MINSTLLDFLRRIAIKSDSRILKGSTKKIAEEMGVSQQSISRYLILLENQGFIIRKRVKDGEEIVLTEKSYEEFRRLFFEIKYIMNQENEIEVEGTLFSGMGEGSYYMSRDKYVEGVRNSLSFKPFPGTLNLRISESFSFLSEVLNVMEGYRIGEFEEAGRKFGAVKVMKATVRGEAAGIVFPERTHYNGVLEIISPDNLREKYKLEDGNILKVSILRK